MTITELIEKASGVTGRFEPGKQCTSGEVGAAVLTKEGNVYTGVNIDCACGIGFCAEHAAIAEMLKHQESEIIMIVAVNENQQILPPCGRCRELMYQVNKANAKTKVILNPDKTITLKELLPYNWQDVWN
jgi:cytidine deaminase